MDHGASMHRCGLLPEQYGALGANHEVGRKLLAAAVQRGEADLRTVRGVRRELLHAIESNTTAAPLQVIRREEHARTGIPQARRDCPRTKARKDRHHGQPGLEAAVQDGEDLGHHRQT